MMKLAILGAGKVGTTIALMLKKSKFCSDLLIADIEPRQELKKLAPIDVVKLDITDRSSLKKFIVGRDAIVSAAPFFLNQTIAEACAQTAVAYFDLTEDVETTLRIRSLGRKYICHLYAAMRIGTWCHKYYRQQLCQAV